MEPLPLLSLQRVSRLCEDLWRVYDTAQRITESYTQRYHTADRKGTLISHLTA